MNNNNKGSQILMQGVAIPAVAAVVSGIIGGAISIGVGVLNLRVQTKEQLKIQQELAAKSNVAEQPEHKICDYD